jgi:DNA (cytosine-5)-methyltransferase 1
MRFIDLFSGCGGLSLGLSWTGAQGLFAVERDPMAFETFKANFMVAPRGRIKKFEWPEWLSTQPWSIDDLLTKHNDELSRLRHNRIELVAGGPPCQGFSFAGRRNPLDPRNLLFMRYLDFVRLVKPTSVLLENVPGMAVAHGLTKFSGPRTKGDSSGSFFEALKTELDQIGYDVEGRFIDASHFGVPQRRTRLIVIGILRETFSDRRSANRASFAFEQLESSRLAFSKALGLDLPVSAHQAIGDLSLSDRNGAQLPLKVCEDPESRKGFLELCYDEARSNSSYQKLMRSECNIVEMDSMRLTRHSKKVEERFSKIISTCRKGVRMNNDDRANFKLRKQRVYPMSASAPAPTVTTLPDDILHFCDPRILTVRECARIQSFPDWFVFKGKYTTGGNLRTKECPRYTQVGNAVPPLLGLAIGLAIRAAIEI